MKKPRNPVAVMDSVDALDLIGQCIALIRRMRAKPIELFAKLKEQQLRHKRALRTIIGTEAI